MRVVAAWILSVLVLGRLSFAQCGVGWLPGEPFPGADNVVTATCEWDPDGAGPRGPLLVLAGAFARLGGRSATGIGTFDPATREWSVMSLGLTGGGLQVYSMVTLPDGSLVAGGSFTRSGSLTLNRVARWGGLAWSAFGSGLPATVYALAVLPNGDLLAGGDFSIAGGGPADLIARWNGTAWVPYAPGLALAPSGAGVRALAVMPNGDLVAGGAFPTANGTSVGGIARWDGTAWTGFGTGALSGVGGAVGSLLVLPGGDLIVGGSFTRAGPLFNANSIAKWDGTAWSMLGTGMNAGPPTVYSLARLPSGDIVAGGTFSSSGGVGVNYISRWNGTAWAAFGAGMNTTVRSVTVMSDGQLIAGGEFSTAGGNGAPFVAMWDGALWRMLGSGLNSPVYSLLRTAGGDVIAGGPFTTAGGGPANRIARRSGGAWQPLGSGVNNYVNAMVEMPNGDLVAGGLFTQAGGRSAFRVARWDGAA
jgi:hypothetical protein